MGQPFLVRNRETKVEFELEDVAFFVAEYQPKGFEIVSPAPMNYTVPELPKAGKKSNGAAVERTTDGDAGTGNSKP